MIRALLWLYRHLNFLPGLLPDLDWLADQETR